MQPFIFFSVGFLTSSISLRFSPTSAIPNCFQGDPPQPPQDVKFQNKTTKTKKRKNKKKKLSHLSNPPNVFPTILLAESKIFIQPEPNIIPIKPICSQCLMQKMLLQRRGNGRFTAGRQPREPDGETLLAAKGASFGMCEGRVPCYVPIFFFEK